MSELSVARTTSNTIPEHVSDHNELHRGHNLFQGIPPQIGESPGVQQFPATTLDSKDMTQAFLLMGA